MHACHIHGGQRSTSVVIRLFSLFLETVSLSGTWDPLIRVDTSHQVLGLCLLVSPEQGFPVLGTITISSMGAGVARGPQAYGLTLSPLSHLPSLVTQLLAWGFSPALQPCDSLSPNVLLGFPL